MREVVVGRCSISSRGANYIWRFVSRRDPRQDWGLLAAEAEAGGWSCKLGEDLLSGAAFRPGLSAIEVPVGVPD